MTAKKDFKRRVRERMEKTGESYTAARAQVVGPHDEPEAGSSAEADAETEAQAEKEAPFSVVELIDATEDAAKLGLKCDVLVSPVLAEQLEPARILERLRDALMANEDDPAMQLLRGLVFRGARPIRDREQLAAWWTEVRRFLNRAVVGIGGITEAGDMLAFAVDGVMVIAQVGYVPDMPAIPRIHERRRLFLTTPDGYRMGDTTLVLPR